MVLTFNFMEDSAVSELLQICFQEHQICQAESLRKALTAMNNKFPFELMAQPQLVMWIGFECWRRQTEYVECVVWKNVSGEMLPCKLLWSKNITKKIFLVIISDWPLTLAILLQKENWQQGNILSREFQWKLYQVIILLKIVHTRTSPTFPKDIFSDL